MAELIIFPDIAGAVLTAIRTKLEALDVTVPIGDRVPNPRPDAFVVCNRIGGIRANLVVDEATLSFEAWAGSEQAAHDLAQQVRGAVLSLVGDVTTAGTIYRVGEYAGPASSPDALSNAPRFVFTMTAAARGTAV